MKHTQAPFNGTSKLSSKHLAHHHLASSTLSRYRPACFTPTAPQLADKCQRQQLSKKSDLQSQSVYDRDDASRDPNQTCISLTYIILRALEQSLDRSILITFQTRSQSTTEQPIKINSSNSPSLTMPITTNSTFPQFSRLPKELQIAIYHCAAPVHDAQVVGALSTKYTNLLPNDSKDTFPTTFLELFHHRATSPNGRTWMSMVRTCKLARMVAMESWGKELNGPEHKVRENLKWMEGEWVWVGSERESELRLKAD